MVGPQLEPSHHMLATSCVDLNWSPLCRVNVSWSQFSGYQLIHVCGLGEQKWENKQTNECVVMIAILGLETQLLEDKNCNTCQNSKTTRTHSPKETKKEKTPYRESPTKPYEEASFLTAATLKVKRDCRVCCQYVRAKLIN